MKFLAAFFSILVMTTTLALADDVRNLTVNPLTENEKIALEAATSVARDLNQKVAPECVNASFKAGTEPVTVQFYNAPTDSESATCTDAHYSIEVEIDQAGKVTKISVLDA